MVKTHYLIGHFREFLHSKPPGCWGILPCLKSVQKKFKKALTLNLPFGIVASHTVTYIQKMRTKTLLLSAAAVVAGLLSAQAQSNVFSANIVGYVSVTNAANQFTLLANPLDAGNNTLTNLFPSAPNGTLVEIWNGTGFTPSTKSFAGWTVNLTITPGQGFFIKFPTDGTNTFVGNIIVPNGGSVTNTLTAGLFTLNGSPIPYTDTLTGTNLNLPQANGTLVETWNGTTYVPATKSFAGWTVNPTIQPGQGFFLKPTASGTWVQSLNVQ
jgi:hypothetical protein